ncbi:MAG TPA: hypothetical protein IAA60_09085 [Candidatus Ornithomonoglobus intestinigallinarum]|uniref:Uncharacterized protein n=1 Tax=Candidatus Ornithomonoglobus intestinigallinarum TaxID=2840894 RepID=A0A9D1H5E4_9FIRM|nr:hypothetical protein [Candidatus Ornithomonoglobus intestinigallinarum]
MKKYEKPEIKISRFSCERIAMTTESGILKNSALSQYVSEGIEVRATSYNEIFRTTN